MTLSAHTLCIHLASNAAQPLAMIIDDDERETFNCTVCAAETIGCMASSIGPGQIANRVRFDRCQHNGGEFCNVCYQGVTGYLRTVWSMAHFVDQRFANRFKKTLSRIASVNGFQSSTRHHTQSDAKN